MLEKVRWKVIWNKFSPGKIKNLLRIIFPNNKQNQFKNVYNHICHKTALSENIYPDIFVGPKYAAGRKGKSLNENAGKLQCGETTLKRLSILQTESRVWNLHILFIG